MCLESPVSTEDEAPSLSFQFVQELEYVGSEKGEA